VLLLFGHIFFMIYYSVKASNPFLFKLSMQHNMMHQTIVKNMQDGYWGDTFVPILTNINSEVLVDSLAYIAIEDQVPLM
jgi:hypothetical protein